MQGRAVLFSLGFDTFTPSVELEARRSGLSPREWTGRRCERVRSQLEKLGCSCDWERAFVSCDPENYRWTQWLFLAMLERDLVYERDGEWVMRIEEQRLGDAEQRLEALAGGAASESERAVLGRVDGVELEASTFGGGDFTVFTPFADRIAETKFIALSPAHPQVRQMTGDPAVAKQISAMREAVRAPGGQDAAGETPLVVTSALATVPGVSGMLPVVVTPLVDVRYGPTAVLGLPELDATDRAIASRLPRPAGTVWKTSSSESTQWRPAARYRMRELVISRPGRWGAPIPLVRCSVCGAVPVPLENLPLRVPEDSSEDASEGARGGADLDTCACPRCGGPARHVTCVIDGLDRMWMWLAPCVPAANRPTAMMSDPERARWLPVEQIVTYPGPTAGIMLERLVLAGIMRDLGALPADIGEPFSRALTHQTVRMETAGGDGEDGAGVGDDALTELDELLERVGGDALRLAVLYAAAPARPFRWTHMPLRHCERFLQSLYGYAEPRLREWAPYTIQKDGWIDASDKLRRRLAHWCATACERVTLQIEQLALQRAAHNLMLLLARIMDFESRVLERRGDLEPLDREAIAAALLLLTRLIAPLTPHLAEELWSVAGNEPSVTDAGWPTPSRPACRGSQ